MLLERLHIKPVRARKLHHWCLGQEDKRLENLMLMFHHIRHEGPSLPIHTPLTPCTVVTLRIPTTPATRTTTFTCGVVGGVTIVARATWLLTIADCVIAVIPPIRPTPFATLALWLLTIAGCVIAVIPILALLKQQ
jgi:hypothetical protein